MKKLSNYLATLMLLVLSSTLWAVVPAVLTEVPKAAFEYGSNSGIFPQTDDEGFSCAVQWDVWSAAFISKAVPKDIEDSLPWQVSAYQSNIVKLSWREKIAQARETTPMLVMVDIIKKTPSRTSTEAQVIAGLQGDRNKLFRSVMNLANCSPR